MGEIEGRVRVGVTRDNTKNMLSSFLYLLVLEVLEVNIAIFCTSDAYLY